jgi:hypothetical protein
MYMDFSHEFVIVNLAAADHFMDLLRAWEYPEARVRASLLSFMETAELVKTYHCRMGQVRIVRVHIDQPEYHGNAEITLINGEEHGKPKLAADGVKPIVYVTKFRRC